MEKDISVMVGGCGRVGVLGVRVWWCLGIPIGVYGG